MSKERTSTQINKDLKVLLSLQRKLMKRWTELQKIVYTYEEIGADEDTETYRVAKDKLQVVNEELHYLTARIEQLQAELTHAERGKSSGEKFGF